MLKSQLMCALPIGLLLLSGCSELFPGERTVFVRR